MTNITPLPVTVPEGYVVLPGHQIAEGSCVVCGEVYETETYEQYVEHWYATEYEGVVVYDDGYQFNPEPITREVWAYLRDSCFGERTAPDWG